MFAEEVIPYKSEMFFIGYIFIVLFVSYCVYRFFERPAQNHIRKRWLSLLN